MFLADMSPQRKSALWKTAGKASEGDKDVEKESDAVLYASHSSHRFVPAVSACVACCGLMSASRALPPKIVELHGLRSSVCSAGRAGRSRRVARRGCGGKGSTCTVGGVGGQHTNNSNNRVGSINSNPGSTASRGSKYNIHHGQSHQLAGMQNANNLYNHLLLKLLVAMFLQLNVLILV